MSEVEALKAALLAERQKYVALVSHLEGPCGVAVVEPGTYIHLLHVFTDGSGYVQEFKKVADVPAEEAAYPCKEWRDWHSLPNRKKHEMPYSYEDLKRIDETAATNQSK